MVDDKKDPHIKNVQNHPITEAILSGEVSLDYLTYTEFVKDFEVFESEYKARSKGYEAHHLNPRALQWNTFKEEHPDFSREEFEKSKFFDRRCYRLTVFEHIIIHYLLARDFQDQASLMFLNIVRLKSKILEDTEKEILRSLKDFSTLREKAHLKTSENNKKRIITEEERKRRAERMRGHVLSEEARKKISEKNKGHPVSEESRRKISEKNKGRPAWNKGKDIKSTANIKTREKWANRRGIPHTEETKKQISDFFKGKPRPEETKQLIKERMRLKRIAFHKEKELGNFEGSWNEWQSYYEKQYNKYTGEKKYMIEDTRKNTYDSPFDVVRKAICLVSGGMDSTTCLFGCVKELGAENVYALSAYYGQKSDCELRRAEAICKKLGVQRLEMNLSPIFSINKNYSSYIQGSNRDIETGTYAEILQKKQDEGKVAISDEYIPNRNSLLLNVVCSIGLQLFNNEKFAIVTGVHCDDAIKADGSNVSAYPDCSLDFTNAENVALQEATAGLCYVYTPLANKTKKEVAEFGIANGMTKADFKNTWSCYSGAKNPEDKEGTWDDKTGRGENLCPTCADKLKALVQGAGYTVEDVLDQFAVSREFAEKKVKEYSLEK